MCGIAGFIDPSKHIDEPEAVAANMATALSHRGPDASDKWLNHDRVVGFAHTRLSIQDLSEAGKQPMTSASGRYVITYNGEVYNAPTLRKQLQKHQHHFRGHSDTEAILAAVEEYGLEKAVQQFIGMFAFALWDKQDKTIHLVRDRLGIKPLYYGWQDNIFFFASEIKSIRKIPGFSQQIDRNSLSAYLRFNYVPTPYSIYENVHKLKPGNILTLKQSDVDNRNAQTREYWSIYEDYTATSARENQLDPSEETTRLESLLKNSVSLRMLSDVPLGAFLSGGVDSSAIVALMQAQSSKPIKTFTIGFSEQNYNEAEHARKVAEHLKTDHTELYLSPKDAMDVIPLLPDLYDEPFADSSQIPTYLVSKLASEHVTVCLSGDGGDELFSGYNRHEWAQTSWDSFRNIPPGIRKFTSKSITSFSPLAYDQIYNALKFLLPTKLRFASPGDKLHKLANIITAENPEMIYRKLVSQWDTPTDIVINAHEPTSQIDNVQKSSAIKNISQRMMYLDTITYLPDDILTKVDRASMGVGLEARVPLIDHRLVEYAAGLPMSMKLRNKQSKWLLRQVLYKYVPKELIERPKMGFAIPLDQWYRTSLRGWCESLLSEERIRNEGFFHPEPIQKMWKEHLSGKRNWHLHLWSILMFQSWLDAQRTT